MAKIVSLNVKVLNSNVKRHLLNELKSLGADIVFIQERYFSREGNFAFARRHYPTVFLASQERKKSGVAILISQSFPHPHLGSDYGSRWAFYYSANSLPGDPVNSLQRVCPQYLTD